MPYREKSICPNCKKPMRLALVKGLPGRKFQCLDCEGEDPLRSSKIARLLNGDLRSTDIPE
jgi:hypothetical protein